MSEPTLDFETYSEAGYRWDDARQKWASLPGVSVAKRGLEVVGVDRYVNHPTFRPISLAFDLIDGHGVERATFPDHAAHYPCPPRLAEHVRSGKMLEAWNVAFEHFVWEWCVKNWGWPVWPLAQQLCAMAKSRAAAYPGGLDNCASVLGTERKDPIGHRLVRKLTVPKNPTKKNTELRWTEQTAPVDFEAFYKYNEQDVRAEIAASDTLPPMNARNMEVWRFDQTVNRRGMAIDMAGVENCIAIVEQASERGCAERHGRLEERRAGPRASYRRSTSTRPLR